MDNDEYKDSKLFKLLKNSEIETIYSGNFFSNLEGIDDFLSTSKKIKSLYFNGSTELHQDFDILSKGIERNNSLEILQFLNLSAFDRISELSIALARNYSITELYLTQNNINDKDCEYIAYFLSNNHFLKVLDLSYNNMTSDGVKILASALSNHKKLKRLSLSSNRIRYYGCITLGEYLSLNPNLESLVIHDGDYNEKDLLFIIESMKNNTKLKYLTYSHYLELDKSSSNQLEDFLFRNQMNIEALTLKRYGYTIYEY